MEERLKSLESKVDVVIENLKTINYNVKVLDENIQTLNKKVEAVDNRISDLHADSNKGFKEVKIELKKIQTATGYEEIYENLRIVGE